jgi:hypothetical protein
MHCSTQNIPFFCTFSFTAPYRVASQSYPDEQRGNTGVLSRTQHRYTSRPAWLRVIPARVKVVSPSSTQMVARPPVKWVMNTPHSVPAATTCCLLLVLPSWTLDFAALRDKTVSGHSRVNKFGFLIRTARFIRYEYEIFVSSSKKETDLQPVSTVYPAFRISRYASCQLVRAQYQQVVKSMPNTLSLQRYNTKLPLRNDVICCPRNRLTTSNCNEGRLLCRVKELR